MMNYYLNLGIRVFIPLILGYSVIDAVISPFTLFLSGFLINFIEPIFIIDNFIFFRDSIAGFVSACAAPSAYYFLLMLVCYTKNIKLIKGLKIIFYGSLIILIVNLIRIYFLLYVLDVYGLDLFRTLHLWFWGFIATIIVAFIWIYFSRRYRIKSIPIYSDLKYLLQRIKLFK